MVGTNQEAPPVELTNQRQHGSTCRAGFHTVVELNNFFSGVELKKNARIGWLVGNGWFPGFFQGGFMVYHGFWLVYMVLLVENTTKLYPGPTIQSRPCRP